MNWKTWVPLVLAIVLGLFSAKLVRDVIAKRSVPQMANPNLTRIVVTARPVAPGQEIRIEDLTLGEVSVKSVPEGAFTKTEQIAGRVAQIQLGKGQPIAESLLAPQGSGTGIAALVPIGMRAFTIQVDEFSGLAGMLMPGSRVDVLASIQSSGGGEMLARTIVQNVKVQAIGQTLSAAPAPGADGKDKPAGPAEPTRSVTLVVTPGEAEALELACATGRPRLVLRSGRDDLMGSSEGVSVGLLRGDKSPIAIGPTTPGVTPTTTTQPAQPVAVPNDPFAYGPTTRPSDVHNITVIRAGQSSIVTIDVPQPKTAAVGSGDSSVDANGGEE